MTIIYRKEPRKPKKKPRTAGLAYEAFQNARALAAMRATLSSDGLFTASSKALGTSLGTSQPTAIRIIRRLIAQKAVHLVGAATDKFGKPVTDALGRQLPNRLFPWRRPHPSMNTPQPKTQSYDPSRRGLTSPPYSSANACTHTNNIYSPLSVSYKYLDYKNISMYPSMNTAPPQWAIERQLSAARVRLGELEGKLKERVRHNQNVSEVDGEIAEVKEYITDLEMWEHDAS